MHWPTIRFSNVFPRNVGGLFRIRRHIPKINKLIMQFISSKIFFDNGKEAILYKGKVWRVEEISVALPAYDKYFWYQILS